MDISFMTEQGKFNFRICALIINDNKILAMKDDKSPYYFLPGGRVHMGEPAEEAIIREGHEELGITVNIVRPLWINQGFFTEDLEQVKFHEICIYFLVDIANTALISLGQTFQSTEGSRTHTFEWLDFHPLKGLYFYPNFLKKDIFNLPEELTLRTEIE
ncbi:NUDIX hydrolase [Streptococcus sp. S784/96/1]|uniref:NUDIX hydrolase n=1 Tax=Streptococcus sp. S784/96/1 TaxID=2653499 RepID=UPI00138744B8|nr:NUDIX domain-containing protein [Streptococcus sp. S784/96/1]